MWAEVSKQMTEVWVWTAFLLFQTMKGVSVASSQAEYGITLRVKEAVKFRFSLVFSQKEKKKRNISIMDKEKRKALQNLFLLFSLFLHSNIRLRCKVESSLSWDSEICSWSSARPFKSPKRVKKKKKNQRKLYALKILHHFLIFTEEIQTKQGQTFRAFPPWLTALDVAKLVSTLLSFEKASCIAR